MTVDGDGVMRRGCLMQALEHADGVGLGLRDSLAMLRQLRVRAYTSQYTRPTITAPPKMLPIVTGSGFDTSA